MNDQESHPEKKPEPQPAGEGPEPDGPSRRRRNRQRHLEASVNMDELRELIGIIQENGFAEFELEREGFRIHVRRDFAVAGNSEKLAAQPYLMSDPLSPLRLKPEKLREGLTGVQRLQRTRVRGPKRLLLKIRIST